MQAGCRQTDRRSDWTDLSTQSGCGQTGAVADTVTVAVPVPVEVPVAVTVAETEIAGPETVAEDNSPAIQASHLASQN